MREHPVGHLLAPLIERHDRGRVEAIAFSFGPAERDGLRARARDCGIAVTRLDTLASECARDPGWIGFATLDAMLRMIGALTRTGHVRRAEGARMFDAVWARARAATNPTTIAGVTNANLVRARSAASNSSHPAGAPES